MTGPKVYLREVTGRASGVTGHASVHPPTDRDFEFGAPGSESAVTEMTVNQEVHL